MTTQKYVVKGMTCGHCVNAVSSEIGGIDGVVSVDVDLAAGAVTVNSAEALAEDAVRAAVTEAGYELVAS